MLTPTQSQQLYESMHLIAKILAEAYIEEKSKLEKSLPTALDKTSIITSPQNDDKLTLTIEESAKLLGIGRSKAYEMVNSGEIPSIRFGRRILIPRIKLMEMVSKQS